MRSESTKSLSPKALAQIAQSSTWEQDRAETAMKSERRSWAIAGTATVVALLSMAMATFQSLRPPAAPYPVLVDRSTGQATAVPTVDDNNVPALAALDQHNAAVFVRARESYSFALLQRDYDQVARMTVGETWTPYGRQFVGESALQTVFADKLEHRVTVVSVRLARLAQKGQGGEAVVTFDKQTRPANSPAVTTSRFVATVRYEYRPSLMKKPADRIENPFGFVVVGYRADAELTAPPTTPAGNAGKQL